MLIQIGFSVTHVGSALVEDPPPRPRILVANFDALSPAEVMHLHMLHEQDWFGRIIAIGGVPPTLHNSLAIDHVLGAPYVRDALRDVIISAGLIAETTKLPVLQQVPP